ncbi:MAG: hypothetical protein ACI835_000200 [Planctomycetota bacterium]|jgi:hypothetical protein
MILLPLHGLELGLLQIDPASLTGLWKQDSDPGIPALEDESGLYVFLVVDHSASESEPEPSGGSDNPRIRLPPSGRTQSRVEAVDCAERTSKLRTAPP